MDNLLIRAVTATLVNDFPSLLFSLSSTINTAAVNALLWEILNLHIMWTKLQRFEMHWGHWTQNAPRLFNKITFGNFPMTATKTIKNNGLLRFNYKLITE